MISLPPAPANPETGSVASSIGDSTSFAAMTA
jgi:hypothetical protein